MGGLGTQIQNAEIADTVPVPIKNAASIQKLFLQAHTIMHLARFFLILLHVIVQNSVKHTYF